MVANFLQEHDKLCTWDGLLQTISDMMGMGAAKVRIEGKDRYGPLGDVLHRLAIPQQFLFLHICVLYTMCIVIIAASHCTLYILPFCALCIGGPLFESWGRYKFLYIYIYSGH